MGLSFFLFFHSSFLCLWNDFLLLWLFSSSDSSSSSLILNSSGTRPISQHLSYQSNTFFLFVASASGCTYCTLNSSVTNLALNLYHSKRMHAFLIEIVFAVISSSVLVSMSISSSILRSGLDSVFSFTLFSLIVSV